MHGLFGKDRREAKASDTLFRQRRMFHQSSEWNRSKKQKILCCRSNECLHICTCHKFAVFRWCHVERKRIRKKVKHRLREVWAACPECSALNVSNSSRCHQITGQKLRFSRIFVLHFIEDIPYYKNDKSSDVNSLPLTWDSRKLPCILENKGKNYF